MNGMRLPYQSRHVNLDFVNLPNWGAAKFSGGAAVSAQVVAGVCTQTPERQTQAREYRGLSTDPGHDPPENLVAPPNWGIRTDL